MKKYRYLILAALIACFVGATVLMWRPLTVFAQDPEQLKLWAQETGPLSVLIFGFMNMMQVIIAIIPGGPFEVAAGYMYGFWAGTLICDIAMTLGSVLVFLLVKRFGMKFVLLFFSQEQVDSVHILKNKSKLRTILFVVFLIPGTPKDIITYLVGLSELDLLSWFFICFIGRLPAILFSALGGSALGTEQYGVVIAAVVILIVCYFIGSYFYNKWNTKKAVSAEGGDSKPDDSTDGEA